jgi:hypothetical protein
MKMGLNDEFKETNGDKRSTFHCLGKSRDGPMTMIGEEEYFPIKVKL